MTGSDMKSGEGGVEQGELKIVIYIVTNEDERRYELGMRIWNHATKSMDRLAPENIILNDEFMWDEETKAYRTDNRAEDIVAFLEDWKRHNIGGFYYFSQVEWDFPIYWFDEERYKYTGRAFYEPRDEENCSAILFNDHRRNETVARLDADELDGGELELWEIWRNLCSKVEADGWLDVTNIKLKRKRKEKENKK